MILDGNDFFFVFTNNLYVLGNVIFFKNEFKETSYYAFKSSFQKNFRLLWTYHLFWGKLFHLIFFSCIWNLKLILYFNGGLSCLTWYKVTSKWMKSTKSSSSKFVLNVVFQLNFITKNKRSTIDILMVGIVTDWSRRVNTYEEIIIQFFDHGILH